MKTLIPARRDVLLGFGAAAALAACARAEAKPAFTAYKTPTCPCCGAWVERMVEAGFVLKELIVLEDLAPIRARYGVPDRYASCHTGVIGNYALEGHVPPADVRRLLAEKPAAAGLSVPGMPMGSPGMEGDGSMKEAFETLLILKDGSARVFARHAGT